MLSTNKTGRDRVHVTRSFFLRRWKDFMRQAVLISGGTSGIGLASARLFLEAGACVMLMGR